MLAQLVCWLLFVCLFFRRFVHVSRHRKGGTRTEARQSPALRPPTRFKENSTTAPLSSFLSRSRETNEPAKKYSRSGNAQNVAQVYAHKSAPSFQAARAIKRRTWTRDKKKKKKVLRRKAAELRARGVKLNARLIHFLSVNASGHR